MPLPKWKVLRHDDAFQVIGSFSENERIERAVMPPTLRQRAGGDVRPRTEQARLAMPGMWLPIHAFAGCFLLEAAKRAVTATK